MQAAIKQPLLAHDKTKSDGYIPSLTGVRAVAAYLVFWHHHNPAQHNSFAYQFINQGYTGVSLFFVLSGFLIYHRYANDYFAESSWSWRRYLKGRFNRIFPLYLAIAFLTISLQLIIGQSISWQLIVLNLTLLKGLFTYYKFTGIPQSWSLTVEICFYLLAPFLFIALRRWAVFLLTAGLWGVGLFLWLLPSLWTGDLFERLPFIAFYTFFGRGFDFIVGMWLARRWHENRLPTVQHATYIGLTVSLICITWQAIVSALTTDLIPLFWSELITYNYVLPVGIGLFYLGLLLEKSHINRWLSLPIMQALGRSSYAFYLIHNGIMATGLRKLGITHTWLIFLALILIAHGIHFHFELFYKAMGSRISRK